MDDRFVDLLAEQTCLTAVAHSLHDEALEVRLVAVRLVSQLSALNPAVAQPLLRRALLSLQKELCTPDSGWPSVSSSRRRKEDAAQMLQVWLASTNCTAAHACFVERKNAAGPPYLSKAHWLSLADVRPPHAAADPPLLSEVAEYASIAHPHNFSRGYLRRPHGERRAARACMLVSASQVEARCMAVAISHQPCSCHPADKAVPVLATAYDGRALQCCRCSTRLSC